MFLPMTCPIYYWWNVVRDYYCKQSGYRIRSVTLAMSPPVTRLGRGGALYIQLPYYHAIQLQWTIRWTFRMSCYNTMIKTTQCIGTCVDYLDWDYNCNTPGNNFNLLASQIGSVIPSVYNLAGEIMLVFLNWEFGLLGNFLQRQ